MIDLFVALTLLVISTISLIHAIKLITYEKPSIIEAIRLSLPVELIIYIFSFNNFRYIPVITLLAVISFAYLNLRYIFKFEDNELLKIGIIWLSVRIVIGLLLGFTAAILL